VAPHKEGPADLYMYMYMYMYRVSGIINHRTGEPLAVCHAAVRKYRTCEEVVTQGWQEAGVRDRAAKLLQCRGASSSNDSYRMSCTVRRSIGHIHRMSQARILSYAFISYVVYRTSYIVYRISYVVYRASYIVSSRVCVYACAYVDVYVYAYAYAYVYVYVRVYADAPGVRVFGTSVLGHCFVGQEFQDIFF
jgi:hypothetical protein